MHNKILEFFYPKRCPICDGVLPLFSEELACVGCVENISIICEPVCFVCGKPIEQGEREYCLDCIRKKHVFIQGKSAFIYDLIMRESIGRFKYNGRREYAGFFSQVICKLNKDWINNIKPDALVPVPLHIKRLRKRGYNQAEVLADKISGDLGIPVVKDLLKRNKDTLPQKGLSSRDRKKNVADAFFVSMEQFRLYHQIKCVIIIDDIYTTGSTADACAEVLKNVGVENVYFLSICIGKDY